MKTFLCWFLVLAGSSLFAQNGQARFIDFSGSVEIKASGSTDWVPAAPGMGIERNTVVSTGFKSTARISLGNSVLTIRPLTRLTVAEIAQKESDESVSLYLETGRVRAEVSPPSGGKTDFTVRSPSLTASVRGTTFEFDTRQIQVEDGLVLFVNANGQAVYVDGGEQSYINETRVVPPFEVETAFLVPNIPGLSDTGAGTPVISRPSAADTGTPDGGAVDVRGAIEWP